MDFKQVPKKYRPIPFWSWNEKLEPSETKRQAKEMARIGMGGFFMHARGGLQTEYMGDEWFDNVEAAICQSEEDGTEAWAYDENGWPSGFGSGKVNGLGIDYQQKYLRFEDGEKQTDTTIVNKDGVHFYYDINPFYVDTLDSKVTHKFIELIYEPYYDKFKNRITGFFSDEPQISRNGLPWSFVMPETYKEMYGDNLLDKLIELFKPVGDYKQTRIRYWKMVTDLFSNNFMKPIYDWCDSHGLKFTGHLVCEESLGSQLATNGAAMPHYEYFHIPGVDKLNRHIDDWFTGIQLGSAAQQLGKKQTITESFALCGHNVSFSELRGLYEWQARYGATLLCPHLEGYSLRGIRKRDYPPAMYEQQPWWEEYSKFVTAVSRIGMIMSESEVHFNTLLMHPQTMAWSLYDNADSPGFNELTEEFKQTIKALEDKHVLFHLGDETLIERHGRVEGNKFIIGTQTYDTIVVLKDQFFMEKTQALIDEYKKNGGRIVTEDEVKENPVCDNPEIKFTERTLDGQKLYYFVNQTGKKQSANISVGKDMIDILTGEVKPFCGHVDFEEFDSVMLIGDKPDTSIENKNADNRVDLSGEWLVTDCDENILTLDKCDYYFDGELQEKNGYVLNIQERACDLKRHVNIKQVYRVNVKAAPNDAYLVVETPEIFNISINGKSVDKKDCGYLRDRSFRKLNIGGMLKEGENEIVLECEFKQSENIYKCIEKSKIFESEKNKLTYDTEIEPVYLCGNFSVFSTDKFDELERKAFRCDGNFVIDKPVKTITVDNIERQGFLFFSGRMDIEKEFVSNGGTYEIKLDRTGINAINVSVNGCDEITSIWNGDCIDISEYVKEGKNIIRLTLVNNLRNMMGPHHLDEGECISVGPPAFYKEPCVWTGGKKPWQPWNDRYCFVEMSVYNNK